MVTAVTTWHVLPDMLSSMRSCKTMSQSQGRTNKRAGEGTNVVPRRGGLFEDLAACQVSAKLLPSVGVPNGRVDNDGIG